MTSTYLRLETFRLIKHHSKVIHVHMYILICLIQIGLCGVYSYTLSLPRPKLIVLVLTVMFLLFFFYHYRIFDVLVSVVKHVFKSTYTSRLTQLIFNFHYKCTFTWQITISFVSFQSFVCLKVCAFIRSLFMCSIK